MRWHLDPGHGWLEVEKAELKRLGIADKISPFSYMKGKLAYLEQDCDADIYLKAIEPMKKEQGWWEQYIPQIIYHNDAPLRNYSRYRSK